MCRQDLKELRFRPFTEEHDYGVRLKNAKKFISKVAPTFPDKILIVNLASIWLSFNAHCRFC